jgi:hypothetical protein
MGGDSVLGVGFGDFTVGWGVEMPIDAVGWGVTITWVGWGRVEKLVGVGAKVSG